MVCGVSERDDDTPAPPAHPPGPLAAGPTSLPRSFAPSQPSSAVLGRASAQRPRRSTTAPGMPSPARHHDEEARRSAATAPSWSDSEATRQPGTTTPHAEGVEHPRYLFHRARLIREPWNNLRFCSTLEAGGAKRNHTARLYVKSDQALRAEPCGF